MTRIFALTFAALMVATPIAAQTAGYTSLRVDAAHHGRTIDGAIWYPGERTGPGLLQAENPVFQGVTNWPEAPVQAGLHPVVLLSHGMGGEVRSLAWLATGLAARGAIVVAVNHPNSTWSDFDPVANLQHWTRVQDLSAALDTLLDDPRFAGHLDDTRVMAAGFSFGGWTALSMGGLRGSHAGYVAHCETHGDASSHCADMAREGISLTQVDAAAWNAPYGDARVTAVAAIDPGLIWGLTSENAVGLDGKPVRLIGLGDAETRLLATDLTLSGLPDLLPWATFDQIAPANHFTAMPLCKPQGAAILLEEEDDPVCTDPEGADRAAVHDQIIDIIAVDLDL